MLRWALILAVIAVVGWAIFRENLRWAHRETGVIHQELADYVHSPGCVKGAPGLVDPSLPPCTDVQGTVVAHDVRLAYIRLSGRRVYTEYVAVKAPDGSIVDFGEFIRGPGQHWLPSQLYENTATGQIVMLHYWGKRIVQLRARDTTVNVWVGLSYLDDAPPRRS